MAEQSLTFVVLTSQAGQPLGTCKNAGTVSASTATRSCEVQRPPEPPGGFLPSLLLQKAAPSPSHPWPLRRDSKLSLYLFPRRVS